MKNRLLKRLTFQGLRMAAVLVAAFFMVGAGPQLALANGTRSVIGTYAGASTLVNGLSTVTNVVCSGENAENLGIAGVADIGGVCFSRGVRLGGIIPENRVKITITDDNNSAVAGEYVFDNATTGEWTMGRFCGTAD